MSVGWLNMFFRYVGPRFAYRNGHLHFAIGIAAPFTIHQETVMMRAWPQIELCAPDTVPAFAKINWLSPLSVEYISTRTAPPPYLMPMAK
jgi:hypothetical protein